MPESDFDTLQYPEYAYCALSGDTIIDNDSLIKIVWITSRRTREECEIKFNNRIISSVETSFYHKKDQISYSEKLMLYYNNSELTKIVSSSNSTLEVKKNSILIGDKFSIVEYFFDSNGLMVKKEVTKKGTNEIYYYSYKFF